MSSAIIVSDVHLGSPFGMPDRFVRFLEELNGEGPLILNGDTVNHAPRFSDRDERALDLLREQSQRRPVIWIRGNHDRTFELSDPARIEMKPSHAFENGTFISHGHQFDPKPLLRHVAVATLHMLYRIYTRMVSEPVAPASFAKKFPVLYSVYRARVATQAARYARDNGYHTMVLGHTHCVADTRQDGIRLLNTGSWTELPLFSLSVNNEQAQLETITS